MAKIKKNLRVAESTDLADRVALVVSLAVILGLVVITTIIFLMEGDDPAQIEIQMMTGDISFNNGLYYLPIEIANRGDRTASHIIVYFTLTPREGESETNQLAVDFLAGRTRIRGVVTFQQDPAGGAVTNTISFLEPD